MLTADLSELSRVDKVPAIIFTFNWQTSEEWYSPFISKYIAGNYNGRRLSIVMLEDGVIHPHDIKKSLWLRKEVTKGRGGEITLRLKTPQGLYRWFCMVLMHSPQPDTNTIIGLFMDIDHEVKTREQLRYNAVIDTTTGIYNKQSFYDSTEKLLAANPQKTHHLVRFDIDRFKIINELYTVSQGDMVLRFVGSLLQKAARAGETYGRLSNDNFCICTARSRQETLALLRDIERDLNAYPISFPFHLSAGLLPITQYDGSPANILCDRAALAQKTVKGNFLQHFAFYEPYMSAALNWEHYIASDMSKALQEGQFQLYLQPQYDMCSGRIIGAEALVRWQHPSEGLLTAGQFIPLFEKNGSILQLDSYIWEQAARVLHDWSAKGVGVIPISVNVSRMHVHDSAFCTKILDICHRNHIPLSLLGLEITESAYVEGSQMLYNIMETLQKEGGVFLMDDFGSGYSALNALKDIPVNIVKIDLNFLKEARRGAETGKKILRAVVQMIQGIDYPVIVEGVETREQVDFLLDIGCVQAQGYYFSQPLPLTEFECLLRKNQAEHCR